MDILDTRKCNLWNLERLAAFLDVDAEILKTYYLEILDDRELLSALNERLQFVRHRYGFTKGIFRKEHVDSVDWFAFERILIYVLLRHLQPDHAIETGVYYGGNTVFLLAALHRNRRGRLVSIDLPDAAIRRSTTAHPRHPLVGDSELYDTQLRPGFIVPNHLKDRWEFVEGDSLVEIPRRRDTFDFYMHDSDHSMNFLSAEIAAVLPRLAPSAVAVVDDIDWSNGFFAFCVEMRMSPILFTDNGKDNLRVRTGVVKLDHPRNAVPAITGSRDGSFPSGKEDGWSAAGVAA
jgi:predicted O-methyltransferase YrrM